MEEDQYRSFGGEEDHVYEDGVQRLRSLLGGARVAMLTTADETGALKSRPMVVQQIDDHGDAWLVADEGSAKVHEVRHDRHVNLAFIRPVRGRWLSVSGRAGVVRDREKLRAMWDPMLQAWFPNGADDPRLCLLKVKLDEAVTWDAPLGNLMQMKRLAGLLLRRPMRGGEQAQDRIVIRSRQEGVGDTAGIFGSAGGNMGVAPRGPRARGPGGGEAGLLPEEVRERSRGRGATGRTGGGAAASPTAMTGTTGRGGAQPAGRAGGKGGGATGTPGQATGAATRGDIRGQATGQATGQAKGDIRGQATGQAKGEAKGEGRGKVATAGRKSPEDVPPVVTGGAVAAALEADVTPPTQPPKPPTRRGR